MSRGRAARAGGWPAARGAQRSKLEGPFSIKELPDHLVALDLEVAWEAEASARAELSHAEVEALRGEHGRRRRGGGSEELRRDETRAELDDPKAKVWAELVQGSRRGREW
ncbi:hypothetical protein PR202_ga30226 [Eleusine coracana subsp. coracana]|uniref:Uncharacterized protein n=1 Tax=Eleusine coracana subsp. coracana TaxID=191504 RepID=A0AAV5DNB4_ELECO|nr:hypothetical protein PR202_ga30226 [Eleusine coracana subsp. coracana]